MTLRRLLLAPLLIAALGVGTAAAGNPHQPPSTPSGSSGNHGNSGSSASNGGGKVTICHATGSATNPFVEITIDESAVPAHREHQGGRDIIPAPAGGCPQSSQGHPGPGHEQAPPQHGAPPEHHKVTICHATGSATNPFVEITIDESAVPAHREHQGGRDIIPAPPGGCPHAAPTQHQVPPARHAPPTVVTAPSAPTTPPAVTPTTAPPTTTTPAAPFTPPTTAPTKTPKVAGVTTKPTGAAGVAGVTATRPPRPSGHLPFTGALLLPVVLGGLGLVASGIAFLRRRSVD